MSDESRLLESGATPFEAKLLASARHDAPSDASRQTIIGALGLAPAITAVGVLTVGGRVRQWLEQAGVLAQSRWVIGGTIGGAVGAAGLWAGLTLSPTPAESVPSKPFVAATQQAQAPNVAEVKPPPRTEPAPEAAVLNSVPAPAVAPRANVPARGALASAAAEQSSLAEELAVLDTARKALGRAEPKRTLRLLDDYAKKFQRPRLPIEASVLRIEALIASGDRASAARLGRDLLARQANSPYERRIRSLIGDPKDSRPAGR